MTEKPQDGVNLPPGSSALVPLLGVLVAIALAGAMKATGSIFIPLVISIFLCYLINFITSALARLRLPEILTIPIIGAVLLGLFLVLELVVVNTISDISEQAPLYQRRLENLVEGFLERLGPHSTVFTEVDWIGRLFEASSSLSVSLFGSVVNFVSKTVLVILYTAFILAGRKAMTNRVIKAFSEARAQEIQDTLTKINVAVQRYVVTKILVSLATGILVSVVLLAFGVDFALFWGLLTFLLNFIPTVGSIIATLFPVLVALLQFDSPWTALWVLICIMVVQQVLGSVIDPILQGRRLNLSPIVILFALVFFGWLWGFWGMVLSIPLTAMIKISMDHTRSLKPIAIMLEKG
ncbi:MAG: AI-2E family transporter [Bradymonadales bacterium]|nr:AI-2E family transporter [Bradymonadales bacterium]